MRTAILIALLLEGCMQPPSTENSVTSTVRFDICKLTSEYTVFTDYKHNICWTRHNSGQGSTAFPVDCKVIKSCNDEETQ